MPSMKFLVSQIPNGRVLAARNSVVAVNEFNRSACTNIPYTGTMIAVTGRPVANRTEYRNGLRKRRLYRDSG